MKGMTGLIVAAGLGVLGAVCNWLYVTQQGSEVAKVGLVGVRSGTQISIGERFSESHFEPVEIPRNRLGNLESHAVRWRDVETLYGFPATRNFLGGEIVLLDDTRTTSRRSIAEQIGKNEVAKWVPVDSRAFVSQRVDPGDQVAFTLPSAGSGGSETETIGPFRILALGTRTASQEVARAAGSSRGSESTITIAVEMKAPPSPGQDWDGELEPRAERLFELLRKSGYQAAEVSLFSAKLEER